MKDTLAIRPPLCPLARFEFRRSDVAAVGRAADIATSPFDRPISKPHSCPSPRRAKQPNPSPAARDRFHASLFNPLPSATYP